MATSGLKTAVREAFSLAEIELDGARPWDPQIHDERFYSMIAGASSLRLGEAYMDGWWDCERLDQFFEKVYRCDLHFRHSSNSTRFHLLKARFLNMQRSSRAFMVGRRHYDRGNELYQAMLGPLLVYSSVYYREKSASFEEAEQAKLELICAKIDLQPGQHILDVGCGWGCFARWAAETHGVTVKGITVSEEQARFAREHCADLPVEIEVVDYREIQGSYDHIVSIGMMGHVGHKNYRSFMESTHRCLKEDGLLFIHTMGANRTTTAADPWVDRYIFPNGMAPSVTQLGEAFENLYVMEDWHNFSTDYGKTTMAWLERFEESWESIKQPYDEEFRRMWRYYLCCFGGAFFARTLQTWDIVLSKIGGREKYISVR